MVGVNLIRLAGGRAHVISLLTIVVFWLWLDIGLGYLLPETRLLNATAAGLGRARVDGRAGRRHRGRRDHHLPGAYGLVLLVVFTPVRHHFGDWLRSLFASIRKLFNRPITPEKPKLITPAKVRKAEPLQLKPSRRRRNWSWRRKGSKRAEGVRRATEPPERG